MQRLPRFLSADEAARFLAAAGRAGRTEPVRRRDRALVAVALCCGLRVAELSRLRLEHVDLGAGTLLVFRGKGGKDRYLPLSRPALDALREHLHGRRRGWVFPSAEYATTPALCDRALSPLSTATIRDRIKVVAREAGIDPLSVWPHALRHTFATLTLHADSDVVEVQRLLGHERLATTAVYLHCQPDRLRPAVDRMAESLLAAGQARLWAVQ